MVFISGESWDQVEKAKDHIFALVREIQVGDRFKAVVKSVKDFGLLVEVLHGKQGILHMSQLISPTQMSSLIQSDSQFKQLLEENEDEEGQQQNTMSLVQEKVLMRVLEGVQEGDELEVEVIATDPIMFCFVCFNRFHLCLFAYILVDLFDYRELI